MIIIIKPQQFQTLIFEKIGGLKECTMVPMDCFYKELTDEEFKGVGQYNFDHPNAFDWDLVKETFEKLLSYQDVIVPNYNYKTCKRDEPGHLIKCTDLILFEGIFALFDPKLREMMDLKVFVHSDDDIRLLRRLKRDVLERGRTVEGVIKSYNRFVKASFDEYIKPTMKYSDIIVPRGKENTIAIQFISENLINRLKERGALKKVEQTAISDVESASSLERVSTVRDTSFDVIALYKNKVKTEIHALHTTLQSLFLKQNPEAKFTEGTWRYLNFQVAAPQSPPKTLQGYLECLSDPDLCTNLCIYLPFLVDSTELAELCETLRQLSFMHSIEKLHVLSPLIAVTDQFKALLNKYDSLNFYTAALVQQEIAEEVLAESNRDIWIVDFYESALKQ